MHKLNEKSQEMRPIYPKIEKAIKTEMCMFPRVVLESVEGNTVNNTVTQERKYLKKQN